MEQKLESNRNFVRVLIEPADHDARYFYRDSYDIQLYIGDQICAQGGKLPYPQFGGEYEVSDEGEIIINPHVDTVPWLEQVIKSYRKMSLKITNFKDSAHYTAKVKGWVPKLGIDIPVAKLLQFLQAQNAGLRTENWRIVGCDFSTHNGNSCHYLKFLIDDPSREVLEENGFKLFVGFTTMTFEPVERVKRCEITGKIVRDDGVKAQLEED